jgi:hypothetical protein
MSQMERNFTRADYENGKLTVQFNDAGHFIDSWNHAEKIGKGREFEQGVMRLIRMAFGRTLPQKQWVHEDTLHEAQPGKEGKITIMPDSPNYPSFFWCEEKGMHGGLIFHQHDNSWDIHT